MTVSTTTQYLNNTHRRSLHCCAQIIQKQKQERKVDINTDDDDAVPEVPYTNAGMSLDEKKVSAKKNKNRIMDLIIKKLPVDKDCYYIEHKEGSDIFKVQKTRNEKIKIE